MQDESKDTSGTAGTASGDGMDMPSPAATIPQSENPVMQSTPPVVAPVGCDHKSLPAKLGAGSAFSCPRCLRTITIEEINKMK